MESTRPSDSGGGDGSGSGKGSGSDSGNGGKPRKPPMRRTDSTYVTNPPDVLRHMGPQDEEPAP